MNTKKSKWTEEILRSMEGSQRAKPDPTVLMKIKGMMPENQVTNSLQYLKYAAVLALFLLLNISVLMFLNNQQTNLKV